MKKLKLQTQGKSLKELLKEYGEGESGFYSQDWYKTEKFFTEKPEAGEYEIILRDDFNKTYKEQIQKLPKSQEVAHPALVAEAVLKHFKETGEKLLENWSVRTNKMDSNGLHVDVGYFDRIGLHVYFWWDDVRDDYVGLAASRKLRSLKSRKLETLEKLSFEITEIKINGKVYRLKK